jgi:hypothetical protein
MQIADGFSDVGLVGVYDILHTGQDVVSRLERIS